jgi:ribonuclease-3
MSDLLYAAYPDYQEGQLTHLRALLVCEAALSQVASSLGVGKALLMDKGEALTGGREKPSVLCDAMEAILAAVYLDSGLEEARRIIHRVLLDKEREEVVEERRRDYKTALQELVQRTPGHTITYELVQELGPDHCRVFVMEVRLDGETVGRGEGRSKKNAEQAAARSALEQLSK